MFETMIIPKALKHNKTLKELDISNRNGSSSGDIKAEGAKHVAEMLKVNAVLKKLDVRGDYSLGEEVQQALREAVRDREGFELLID